MYMVNMYHSERRREFDLIIRVVTYLSIATVITIWIAYRII